MSRYDDMPVGAALRDPQGGDLWLRVTGQVGKWFVVLPSGGAFSTSDTPPSRCIELVEKGRARPDTTSLRAAIKRIHFEYRTAFIDDFTTCAGCNMGMEVVPWPCATIRALEAVEAKPSASEPPKVTDRCGAPWVRFEDGLYHNPTCPADCLKGLTFMHLDDRWGPLTEVND